MLVCLAVPARAVTLAVWLTTVVSRRDMLMFGYETTHVQFLSLAGAAAWAQLIILANIIDDYHTTPPHQFDLIPHLLMVPAFSAAFLSVVFFFLGARDHVSNRRFGWMFFTNLLIIPLPLYFVFALLSRFF